ncbi:AraC family transcriptional regulator [Flavobacterium sp. LS1P28]|uniref:helix-turn-helix domain-containing protein n=1 Tax=unclassified Flavobacterium TaxID=196869 RepID=UPI000F83D0E0|nr:MULTISPECIES: AraC family transcriptional regulator [unclassified Flavobacterium]RTY78568.1 AraC family transcriptional regulator [Flavobacterium sp. LS1P28]RTY84789.1 AraC family transcriptional regulator [Flavobacterium sp. ZB4P23]
MDTQQNQQRIKVIYQMLFEMATGNLSFRIIKTDQNDEVDKLSEMLNTLAGQMHDIILRSGSVNPHYSYQNLVQTTFILDDNFIIRNFNTHALQALYYESEELFQVDFGKLIAPQSFSIWNKKKIEASLDDNYHSTVPLIFITGNNKLLPTFCTISRLHYSDKIIVNSITTILQELSSDATFVIKTNPKKQSEAVVMQSIYDYILNHLEEPLPTLKKLAAMFASEEHKLKIGFRKYFNTSVYNFYHLERLKKSHLLIQKTEIPLKEIAFICGFSAYLNFYKAFKKHYGYAPSDLNRPSE